MLENLKADTRRLKEIKTKPFPWYVLESLLFENGYQAVLLHRLAHFFKRRRIPVLGPFCARLSLLLTGADIAPAAVIGPGLMIGHGVGLVIGHRVQIGANALLLHQVTIGAPSSRRLDAMPSLGDNVFVGAGSRIIGDVRIGDDVFIGTGCVVTRDVPDGSKVTSTAEIKIHPRRAPDSRSGEPA
jgi:serine O-acetyltransferase